MCKPSSGWQRSLKRESRDFSRGRFNLHLLVVVAWLGHYLQTPQGQLRPQRVRRD